MDDSIETKDVDSHLIFRLGDVITYLAQPSVWIVMIGLAVIVTLIDVMAFGLFSFAVTIFIAGVEVSIFFQIASSSAQGAKHLQAPDFLSIFDSVIYPILLVIVAAAPMLLAGYWATSQLFQGFPDGWPHGPLALFLAGVALFPLLLTIAAMDRSVERVLNPAVWVESLRAFGTSYLVAAAGFYVLWLVEVFVFARAATQIESAPMFGASVPALIVFYIPRILRYRLLGALCEPFLNQPVEAVVIIPEATAQPAPGQVSPPSDEEEIAAKLEELESGLLSSRAILQMANTALKKQQIRFVYRIVEYMWKHHQESPDMVQALWVASQAQELEGNIEAMKSTLQRIDTLHPGHPMASEARMKLHKLS